jgi:hypothetical protein
MGTIRFDYWLTNFRSNVFVMGGVLSKVLAGVVLVLGIALYFLWNENTRLSALNQAFEIRSQEQKAAIEQLQVDFKKQTEGLLTLQSKNQEIELEMTRYLDIFKRHNLSKTAAAKPGLLEPKVNNGTKNVFNSIEELSRNIDDLDDGLQLQPDSK